MYDRTDIPLAAMRAVPSCAGKLWETFVALGLGTEKEIGLRYLWRRASDHLLSDEEVVESSGKQS